jgi:hypothetical protein
MRALIIKFFALYGHARKLAIVGLAVLALLGTVTSDRPVHAATIDFAAATEKMIDRDRDTLRRAATRLVALRLASPFDKVETRVPYYADWVYGWLSSIWISFDILRVGSWEVGTKIYNSKAPTLSGVRRELETYVVDEFERQVIVPEIMEAQLLKAWEDTLVRVRDLDRRLAEDRVRRLDGLLSRTVLAPSDAAGVIAARLTAADPLLENWAPAPPPTLRHAPDAGLLDAPLTEHAKAELVLTRSFRPLATRVLSVGSRFVIVPLIGGAIVVPGLEAGGVAATSALTLMVVTGLWTADYAANWADALLNRPGFEAELVTSIRAAQTRTIIEARDYIQGSMCGLMTRC